MALNSRGRYAHYPQLRRWSRFCHLNAAVNHLRRGSPWGATFPSLGDVLERIREREGLSFPGRTYKMLKNPCMGLQEETGRRAMTDPQSNVSKIGGPLLNAGLMATNPPGILSPLAGPILSLHRNRDWGLIQATATYSPSTCLSCLLPNLPAFVPTLPLHTHQSVLSATSPQEWARKSWPEAMYTNEQIQFCRPKWRDDQYRAKDSHLKCLSSEMVQILEGVTLKYPPRLTG